MSFTFTREGITYRVHSEVGNGPARIVVEEQDQQPAQALEPSEEAS